LPNDLRKKTNLLQNHIKEKTQIRIHSKTFLICQTVDKTDCERRNKTKLQLQYSSHKIRKTNPNSCIKYQSFHASILPLHASWRKKSSRKWPATLILKKRTKSVRHFPALNFYFSFLLERWNPVLKIRSDPNFTCQIF